MVPDWRCALAAGQVGDGLRAVAGVLAVLGGQTTMVA